MSNDWLAELGVPLTPPEGDIPAAPPPDPLHDFLAALGPGAVREIVEAPRHEVVIEPSGRVRQAGAASGPEGDYIANMREACERSLFVFTAAILQRDYLTPTLHLPLCNYIQDPRFKRTGALYFRASGKTSIVSHGLPLHAIIQPKERNLYFPNEPGNEVRLILCGETSELMQRNLRVVRTALESNKLLRAFWPHIAWPNPRRDAKEWNNTSLIVPRDHEYPDATLKAMGVDGAITGTHPSGLIKDDLISEKAMNSPAVMQTTIDWHTTSRALIGEDANREWIIGTRWAVGDLYDHIQRTDPTVEWRIKGIIEDGQPTWPERFPEKAIDRIRLEQGKMFALLYLNNASDPALTDFQPTQLRSYRIERGVLVFDEDERDLLLHERMHSKPQEPEESFEGQRLTPAVMDRMRRRDEFLKGMKFRPT